MPSTVRLDDEVNFRTYALSLECTLLNKASIAIEAFFDSNVIDELQMMRVLHHFAYVLKQMSWHGDRKLRDIDLVSPQDKQEIHAWNVEQPALEPASSVHLLIDQRAKSQPDKPAISSWDGDQSYQRLGELSIHLAEYLATLGVRLAQLTFSLLVAWVRSFIRSSSDGMQTHPPAISVDKMSSKLTSKL